jgi:hypothetical protein
LPTLYNNPGDFNDVTSGKAGVGRRANSAGPGYDLATGLGTPNAAFVVKDLVNATAATASTTSTGTGTGGGNGNHHVLSVSQHPGSSSDDGVQAAVVSDLAASPSGFIFITTNPPAVVGRADPVATAIDVPNRPFPVLLSLADASEGMDENMTSSGRLNGQPARVGHDTVAAPISLMSFERSAESAPAATGFEFSVIGPANVVEHASASTPAAPARAEQDSTGPVSTAVTGALTKIVWLIGAALFFTQGALFAKSHEAELEEKERKRLARA